MRSSSGEEELEGLPDDVGAPVALDPLCARVPARNDIVRVEHIDGVIVDAFDEQPELALVVDEAAFGFAQACGIARLRIGYCGLPVVALCRLFFKGSAAHHVLLCRAK